MKSTETDGPPGPLSLVTAGGPHPPITEGSAPGGCGPLVERPASCDIIDLTEHRFVADMFSAADPMSTDARMLECEVFKEDFNITQSEFDDAYDPYDDTSIFVSVFDRERMETVGAARIIVDGPLGLKSVNDAETDWGLSLEDMLNSRGGLENLASSWDLATLAVLPCKRQGIVSMALYQAMFRSGIPLEVTWLFSIVDVRMFRMLSDRLANMFDVWPGARPLDYVGSTCLPVYSDCLHYRQRLAQTRPGLSARLFQAKGTEGLVRFVSPNPAVNACLLGTRRTNPQDLTETSAESSKSRSKVLKRAGTDAAGSGRP